MEIISSIYNSGYNIKKFYLGSQELNLAYLGNQVIYDEVIGDNDLNYILYEFYGSDTLPNTVEAPVKRATLKGSTKYRDIDTGDILDTFDETKNLELVSVKVPALITTGKNLFDPDLWESGRFDISTGEGTNSNAYSKYNEFIPVNVGDVFTFSSSGFVLRGYLFYGSNKDYLNLSHSSFGKNIVIKIEDTRVKYMKLWIDRSIGSFESTAQLEYGNAVTTYESFKSNILTVNEDVTLRSNGDVYDELNLLNGRLTQRIDENNEVLAQEVVKTVDLTIVDQDEKTINKLNSFNGTTHVLTEVAENSIYPTIAIEVATE